jgi:hypothetical protein
MTQFFSLKWECGTDEFHSYELLSLLLLHSERIFFLFCYFPGSKIAAKTPDVARKRISL